MLDKTHLIERVQSFASYPQNWDGMSAEPPAETAISDAEKFIQLLPDNIARPHISLAADGEINFKWATSDFDLSLGVCGDGIYFYYGTDKGREFEFLGDAEVCSQRLPDDILQWLVDTEGNH